MGAPWGRLTESMCCLDSWMLQARKQPAPRLPAASRCAPGSFTSSDHPLPSTLRPTRNHDPPSHCSLGDDDHERRAVLSALPMLNSPHQGESIREVRGTGEVNRASFDFEA